MPNPFQYRPNLAAHVKGLCRIFQMKRNYTKLSVKNKPVPGRQRPEDTSPKVAGGADSTNRILRGKWSR